MIRVQKLQAIQGAWLTGPKASSYTRSVADQGTNVAKAFLSREAGSGDADTFDLKGGKSYANCDQWGWGYYRLKYLTK